MRIKKVNCSGNIARQNLDFRCKVERIFEGKVLKEEEEGEEEESVHEGGIGYVQGSSHGHFVCFRVVTMPCSN